jgi:hypothetical protein
VRCFSKKTSAGGEAGTRKEIMGDNHSSDGRHESDSPHPSKLAQAIRTHAVWRRLRSAGIGVVLFSLAVSLVYLLWPDLRPYSYWIAVISCPVGLVGVGLAITMTSHAQEQLRRTQAGARAVPAAEVALYGLLYAGLVLGGVLASLGLPSDGVGWLIRWLASHHDKPVPDAANIGIAIGLTLGAIGAGLVAISLGFIAAIRRNERRNGPHADGH